MDAGLDPGTGRGALSLRRRVPLGKPFPLDSWFPLPPRTLGGWDRMIRKALPRADDRGGGGSYVAPVEAGSGERSLGWEIGEPAE